MAAVCHVAISVLLLAIAGVSSTTFIISFPTSVYPGVPLKLGISILSSNGGQPVVIGAGFVAVRPGQPGPTPTRASFASDVLASKTAAVKVGQHATMQLSLPAALASEHSIWLVAVGLRGIQLVEAKQLKVGKARSVFIQTDKSTYKPEQEIRMRVLAIQPDLLPYDGLVSVFVKNTEHTTVAQWLNVRLENGLWSGSLPLSSQPPLGQWRITCKAKTGDQLAVATVEVKEYAVLPKFEVSVTLPSFIAVQGTPAVAIQVKAMYTYGQPVKGTVHLQLKLTNMWNEPMQAVCGGIHYPWYKTQLLQLNANGEAQLTMTREQFMRRLCLSEQSPMYARNLMANASVMDDVTGEVRWTEETTKLYMSSLKVEFDRTVTRSSFKPGLPYPVRAVVVTRDNLPAPDKTKVRLTVDTMTTWNSSRDVKILETRNGMIDRLIPLSQNTTTMAIQVMLQFPNAADNSDAISPVLFHSPSATFVKLSSLKAKYLSGETAIFKLRSTVTASIFMCSILSRGRLVEYVTVPPKANQPEEATFTLRLTPAMAPTMKTVCYLEHGGELIVDSLELSVGNPFSNNVTIAFADSQVKPGDNTTIKVKAAAGSTVAVGIVDQSALLMGKGNDISMERVEDELNGYGSSPTGRPGRPRMFDARMSFGGRFGQATPQTADAILKNAGMGVFTKLTVPKPEPRPVAKLMNRAFGGAPQMRQGGGSLMRAAPMPAQFAAGPGQAMAAPPATDPAGMVQGQEFAEPDHTRIFFPETWIWETVLTGSDGVLALNHTVPDSITSWVGGGFATSSEHGLGMVSPTATLNVFKPFFISVNLPYSVIRGEEISIEVNLFNYVQTAYAEIELQSSEDFTIFGATIGAAAAMRNATVQMNSAATVNFLIIAHTSGFVTLDITAKSAHAADRVKRELLVEPEGLPQSYSRSMLINVEDGKPFDTLLNFELPPNVVPGSVRTEVSVIGDIMGPALANLDKLLKMPSGCGEQNMISFAPDVFIMKYLTNTQQLTSAVKEKAKRFMTTGYQRQLTYRRTDNSFSAFGNRDSSGSLWLTAFVLKSFSQATPYIFIDTADLSRSLEYVLGMQQTDGSFPLVGEVFHKSMKGGLESTVARTAYILTALAEAQQVSWGKVANSTVSRASDRARSYLEGHLGTGIQDNYTLALTAYALAVAKSTQSKVALQALLKRGDRSDGGLHWADSRAESAPSHAFSYGRKATAATIELTAYGLLALVTEGSLVEASRVSQWLSLQRNSHGGFGSTQDTVVGLQALAELAARIANNAHKMDVVLETSQYRHVFKVIDSNSKILQEIYDVPAPGEVKISANGTGQVLLSTEVFFNVKDEPQVMYDMQAVCELESFRAGLTATCEYCTRLAADGDNMQKGGNPEGMSLMEVGLPSGFEVDMEVLMVAVKMERLIKKVENPDRRVVLYLDEVPGRKVCVNMTLHQRTHVTNLQAAALKTINYYQPSINSALLYNVASPESCRRSHVTNCPVMSVMDPTGGGERDRNLSGANKMTSSLVSLLACTLVSIFLL